MIKFTAQEAAEQVAQHDARVSCYTATGEDGRPERVHEIRISDKSCRCGLYGSR